MSEIDLTAFRTLRGCGCTGYFALCSLCIEPMTPEEEDALGLPHQKAATKVAIPFEVWRQQPAVTPDYMKAVHDLCKGTS